MAGDDFRVRCERLFHEEMGRMTAIAIRVVRDLDLAEELAQETFASALENWRTSWPDNPAAWLTAAVRNRAVDYLRRVHHATAAQPLLESAGTTFTERSLEPDEVSDDRLRLIFTCCHPQLSEEARVALTLRLLGGLTVPEIARAFLASEDTIAQRLVRAKRYVREHQLPYDVPSGAALAERLDSVLNVLYLVFNEGYTAREGASLHRVDLCAEALRLCRLVCDQLPHPEAEGLCALMELQLSRAATRVNERGELQLLAEQNRSKWDRRLIEQATSRLEAALRSGRAGPYQLQAAIAACHAEAPSWEQTDWPQIAGLYQELLRLMDTPIVRLNRAVAIGMAAGPEAGLSELEPLTVEPRLRDYHLLAAARADFLRRLRRWQSAIAEYRRAASLTKNESERTFLERRSAECERAERG